MSHSHLGLTDLPHHDMSRFPHSVSDLPHLGVSHLPHSVSDLPHNVTDVPQDQLSQNVFHLPKDLSYSARVVTKNMSKNIRNLFKNVNKLSRKLTNYARDCNKKVSHLNQTTEMHFKNEFNGQSNLTENLVPNSIYIAKDTQNIVTNFTKFQYKKIVPNSITLAKESQDSVPYLTKKMVPNLTDLESPDFEEQSVLTHDLINHSVASSQQAIDVIPQSYALTITHEKEILVKSDPPPRYQPPNRILGPPPGYDSNIPQLRNISLSPPPSYRYPPPPPSYIPPLNPGLPIPRVPQRRTPAVPPSVTKPLNPPELYYSPIRNPRQFMRDYYMIYEFYRTFDRFNVSRAFVTTDLYEIPGLPRVHLFSPEHIPHYTVNPKSTLRQVERIVNPSCIRKLELEVFNMAPRSDMYGAMVRFNQRHTKTESPVRKTRDGLLKPENEQIEEKPLMRPLRSNFGPIPDVVPKDSDKTEDEKILDHHVDLTIPSEKEFKRLNRPTTFPVPLVKTSTSNLDQEKAAKDKHHNIKRKSDKKHSIVEKFNAFIQPKPSLFIPSKASRKNKHLDLSIELDDDILTVGFIKEQKENCYETTTYESKNLKGLAEALTPKNEGIFNFHSDSNNHEPPVFNYDHNEKHEDSKCGHKLDIDPLEIVYEPPELFRESKLAKDDDDDENKYSAHEADFDIISNISKKHTYKEKILNHKSSILDQIIRQSLSETDLSNTFKRPQSLPTLTSLSKDISQEITKHNFKIGYMLAPKWSKPKSNQFIYKHDDDLAPDIVVVPGTGQNSIAPIEFLAPHCFDPYEDSIDEIAIKIESPQNKPIAGPSKSMPTEETSHNEPSTSKCNGATGSKQISQKTKDHIKKNRKVYA